jgi:hypothetical protein
MTTIERVRKLNGAPHRRRPEQLARFNLPARPEWANREGLGNYHPIRLIFDNSQALFAGGTICWGYVVMANTVLFRSGPEPCSAAAVVWSADPFVDRFPHWLAGPASHLGHYNTESTPAPQPPTAHYLYLRMRDHFVHGDGIPLPPYMTEGRLVHLLAVPIFREHLPKGYLTGQLMPLLVLPRTHLPAMGMVLPCAVWPEELRRAWERG